MNSTRVPRVVREAGVARCKVGGLAMLSLLGGCGGANDPSSELTPPVEIAEYTTCQGEAFRPMFGSTVEIVNVVFGTLLAGDATSSSLTLSAGFLTDRPVLGAGAAPFVRSN